MQHTDGRDSTTCGGGGTDFVNVDTITARDLLKAIQKKDRQLLTLLEPTPAQTFHVIPDLSHNISAFDGFEDDFAAHGWIARIQQTSTVDG